MFECGIDIIDIDTIAGDKKDLYMYLQRILHYKYNRFLKVSNYIDLNENIEIIDHDWNKWVMQVEEGFTIQVGY